MLTPAEVIKQNAQMVNSSEPQSQSKSHKQNNVTAMRQVLMRFRSHPWRLWSGYTALVGRNLPFTGIQFPLFEYVRSHVIDWRRRRKSAREKANTGDSSTRQPSEKREQLVERAGLTGISAAVSGTFASLVTTPIDVIKTRVMLSASDYAGDGGSGSATSDAGTEGRSSGKPTKGASKGTIAVGRGIFQKDGIRGFFKGGAIRAGWTAVAMSLYLGLYEGGRLYLENRRKELEGVKGPGFKSQDGDAIM